MTSEQFNEKYKDYLEEGHYGCAVDNGDEPELIKGLDERFQEFIKIPNFSYSQIKLKFGYARFYTKGLTSEQNQEVENYINQYFKNKL